MWSSLEYFSKVAELGSFTAAAKALGITQPSLSVAIAKLEGELNTTLFVRHARGVTLTASGAALLRQARSAFAALDHARDVIHGLEHEPRGRFVVGVHGSLGAYFLPGFMGKFIEQHPLIELSLMNANSRDVQQAVIDRSVDIGIVVNPDRQDDCVVKHLFDDRVAFVATTRLTRKHAGSAVELLSERPLIYVPALQQTQYLLACLDKRRIQRGPELACDSLELVKSLVLDNVGVGILPIRVATHGIATGRLEPLGPELPHFRDHVGLVYRADAHRTRAFKLVTEAISRRGAQLA